MALVLSFFTGLDNKYVSTWYRLLVTETNSLRLATPANNSTVGKYQASVSTTTLRCGSVLLAIFRGDDDSLGEVHWLLRHLGMR